jgi:hypothetical protein
LLTAVAVLAADGRPLAERAEGRDEHGRLIVRTWPRTVDEAVARILSTMSAEDQARVRSTPKDELIRYHMGWGTGIRNSFGLWKGNKELLNSCGYEGIHPDTCSDIIIHRVWAALQSPAEPASPNKAAAGDGRHGGIR